ncbi:MalY/PatB family protein [Paenibacillus pini]|uniref:cysteine-S-conjugate beta-lyase n=1 Tax=Paenibacillus pini JCM 16418 TaxID=1236976 RepID=W7YLF4_9BACL|nr:MalY/PatB family protein [Paenibacillus pini]GAF08563.1 cystathionine beta-lyase [Paenibacillus pini JCM 16418]
MNLNKHDFNEVVNRKMTAAEKWDGMERVFGVTDVLPLWVADMDFKAPASVIEAIEKRVEHGVFGYTLQTHDYKLSVAQWMQKRHQWTIDMDWIVFSPGVVPALSFAVQAFTEPGDKVLIQTPVYPPFYQVVTNHGRELVMNPLQLQQDGTYVMDLEALERSLDDGVKLLILCSPHNPVGRVWSVEELEAISRLCAERGVLIVSDEIHADLVFEGKHTPLAMISEQIKNQCIICTSPSKTFNIAGLNTSNIIIPNDEIRKKFQQTVQLYAVGSISALGSVATEAAYNGGEVWLDEALEYIRDNMHYIQQFIAEHIPEIHVTLPEATYLLWLDFRSVNMSSDELAAFLLTQAKLALNQGASFGTEGEGFMRMNVACPRSIIEEAMHRLHSAMQNLRAQR